MALRGGHLDQTSANKTQTNAIGVRGMVIKEYAVVHQDTVDIMRFGLRGVFVYQANEWYYRNLAGAWASRVPTTCMINGWQYDPVVNNWYRMVDRAGEYGTW